MGRRRVRACIDDAENTFAQCWRTLVAIKGLKVSGNEMFEFQPNLATALFKLDDIYRRLTEARKRLIRDKVSHPAAWFEQRMRSSDKDLKGLRSAIDVGRSLGDAFAWLFYKQDQPLLERHFKQPLNPHTPAGIGGIGELEFVRQIRPPGFFALYHGITSFLRIGDVSFYDLKTRRISSIGELKSTPVGPGKLTIWVHLIGKMGSNIPFVDPARKVEIMPKAPHPARNQARFQERLKKQLKLAAEVARAEANNRKASLLDAYHMKELGLFAKELSENGIAYQQVGQGLLIAGAAAFRGRSLSGRIFSKTSDKSVLKRMRKITLHVTALADPTLPDNSLYFSEFDNCVRLGWPPLFWYPCEADFLEALYFQRLMIATVYNPAHLFKRLRALGYQVTLEPANTDAPPAIKVTKKTSNGVMQLEHFDFFLRLIQQRFMREERIVEMLDGAANELPQLSPGEAARVQFGFVHMF
jgi:hypothetical protein